MKSPLSYQARRELVELMAPQYRAASRSQKMRLLDTFVALTGSVRNYAMWLLNHPSRNPPQTADPDPHFAGLDRSGETVLAAFQRARTLFPFPIVGFDTDNGREFLNEQGVAYCEQEQMTFTRGRPYQKRDQCFVEQKHGAIVRKAGRL